MAKRKRTQAATKGLKPKKTITASQRRARKINIEVARRARQMEKSNSLGSIKKFGQGKGTLKSMDPLSREAKIKRIKDKVNRANLTQFGSMTVAQQRKSLMFQLMRKEGLM